MKVLANDGLSVEASDLLVNHGFEVIDEHIAQEDLVNYLNENNIDALLVRSNTEVRQELIEEVPSLKLIGRAGVGMDNIDVEFAQNMGLHVINTPKASTTSVAELTFAHIFSIARFLFDSNRNMPLEGDINFKGLKQIYQSGVELYGKTLGIIGLGKIGEEVAKIGIKLGMNVVAADGSNTEHTKNLNITFPNGQKIDYELEVKPLKSVLKTADFVSLHLPSQEKYIIGKKEFELMKDGAFLINTSRGGLVDEVALIEALEMGKLSAAGLDVFEDEPQPAVQILMHPKISITPHIGGSTVDAQNKIGLELAQQIIALLNKDLY